jgi:MFS family permease
LIGALAFSTLATGLLQICLPLELVRLHASPVATGASLSMFGFGMFAFEWLWGVAADKLGYRLPLVASQVLYAVFIVALSQVDSVVLIAASYFLASGMMVAVGPIARSYLGTALHSGLRATGLALLASQWVVAEAVGAGAGGALIDRLPIHEVILAGSALPAVSAVLVAVVFRGYVTADHRSFADFDEQADQRRSNAGTTVVGVLVITAGLALLVQIGLGGELALLPLLVTSQLHLSASAAGSALLAVGLIAGVLLVPGGGAADRWGRRPSMIAGGILLGMGYVIYALAGNFTVVIVGAAVRAGGASLIWPAATAWIAESMPRRRHAFYMGIFGEFENVGVTVGPAIGGLIWSWVGIRAAFYSFAVAAFAAAVLAAVMVASRSAPPKHANDLVVQDLRSRR